MCQDDELQDKLLDSMQQKLHLTIPSIETDLFQSGDMDSLVFIDLLMLLETEYGISIDMASIELDDFKSVKSIMTFVRHQKPAAGNMPPAYGQLSVNR